LACRINSGWALGAKRVGAAGAWEGLRLRVEVWGRHYVRAKNLKCVPTPLKNWRFKTRFFASFLFAFEKK
jgi:hypothetical protein